jgi:hypothetical protein
MSNNLTFKLKGEYYKVKFGYKANEQSKYNALLNDLNVLMSKVKEKKDEIKACQMELLTDRQKIIYSHPVDHGLTAEAKEENKKHIKRKEALEAYDNEHGKFYE